MKSNIGFKKIFVILICFALTVICMSALAFADESTVLVDGKEVKIGEQLDYEFTYKNVIGNKVDVTIENIIPHNTVYVEGSADNGGEFADGKLTWQIDGVEPWETVTVKFKVEVSPFMTADAEIGEAVNQFTTKTAIVTEQVECALVTAPEFEIETVDYEVKELAQPKAEVMAVEEPKPEVETEIEVQPVTVSEEAVQLKVPNTSDESSLIMWLVMLVLSGGAAAYTLKLKLNQQ